MSQRPGSWWRLIPSRLTAFQGEGGFGVWAAEPVSGHNPSSLNSGTNGLSEVMEVTFQTTQQKCDNKKNLSFGIPSASNTNARPLPHVSIFLCLPFRVNFHQDLIVS